MLSISGLLKVLSMPWRPSTSIPEIPYWSMLQLYAAMVLPLAAVGPIMNMMLYLMAPYRSAIMPELSFAQLAYIATRDTASGMLVVFIGAKLIFFCAPYFGAIRNGLRAHYLATASIAPILLIMALRLFVRATLLLELQAILYAAYLLSRGAQAMLSADASRSRGFAALVTLNTLAFVYFGEQCVVFAQLWVVHQL